VGQIPWTRDGLDQFGSGTEHARWNGEDPDEARQREEDEIDARFRYMALVFFLGTIASLAFAALFISNF